MGRAEEVESEKGGGALGGKAGECQGEKARGD